MERVAVRPGEGALRALPLHQGDADGTYGWDGAAEGQTPAAHGNAEGTFGWAGSAAGRTLPLGHAVGTFGWDGAAAGPGRLIIEAARAFLVDNDAHATITSNDARGELL